MKFWSYALTLSLCFLTITQLHAALPPLYQTSKEIQAIIASDELGHALPSGEPILEIRKNDDGYEITTLRHKVQVGITYLPQQMPGPAKFEVHFSKTQKL